MRHAIAVTAVSLTLLGPTLAWGAPDQDKAGPDPKIGTRVTITGCLHQGESKDSFVLVGVTERPADSTAPVLPVPIAIYWLDSTKGLKEHVGRMVDITGKVTGRRPKLGTITVSTDVSETRSTDVQVTSASETLDATTKKFEGKPGAATPSDADSKIAVQRPVYKLDVEKVAPAANFPTTGPECR